MTAAHTFQKSLSDVSHNGINAYRKKSTNLLSLVCAQHWIIRSNKSWIPMRIRMEIRSQWFFPFFWKYDFYFLWEKKYLNSWKRTNGWIPLIRKLIFFDLFLFNWITWNTLITQNHIKVNLLLPVWLGSIMTFSSYSNYLSVTQQTSFLFYFHTSQRFSIKRFKEIVWFFFCRVLNFFDNFKLLNTLVWYGFIFWLLDLIMIIVFLCVSCLLSDYIASCLK